MIACLAFADIEHAGYSPLITPVADNNNMAYLFNLNGVLYISTGTVLSEFRTRRCKGRGTRVITVKQYKDETSPTFALKYYWKVHSGRPEWFLIDAVRKSAVQNSLPTSFLLTMVAGGYMEWKRNDETLSTQDSTYTLLRGMEQATKFYEPSKLSSVDAYLNPDPFIQGAGEVPAIRTGDPSVDESYSRHMDKEFEFPLQYTHREHVFLLFEEVGIALHDIYTASTFFLAMRESVKG